MRVLILNQYFPPDPAPTGLLLADVAEALRRNGHTVLCLGAAQEYHDRQRLQGRMKREARALWALLRRGLQADKPDVIISGSSPPCLLLVAALLSLRHRARSVHWAMDLYPELAVSLGEIPPGPLPRVLRGVMGMAYRASEVVSVDDDMAALLARRGIPSTPLQPWVTDTERLGEIGPVQVRQPFRWLYSGNLGRAHDWRTLIEAQALLETRGCAATLVFQGSGAGRAAAEERSRELSLRQVEFLDYAPPGQFLPSLLEAGALVASQRPETLGMLWPSKLAMLQAIPRPLLWIGPREGRVARWVTDKQQGRAFAPGECAELADFVERLTTTPQGPAMADLDQLKTARATALEQWVCLIEG